MKGAFAVAALVSATASFRGADAFVGPSLKGACGCVWSGIGLGSCVCGWSPSCPVREVCPRDPSPVRSHIHTFVLK